MTQPDRICAFTMAAAMVQAVGHLLREEERKDLFDEMLAIALKALERRQEQVIRRMKLPVPSRN